jgi:hypothetical protein
MRWFILSVMALAITVIVVAHGFNGSLLRGLVYAGVVFGTARVWWRARANGGPVPEVADNIAVFAATLALFLAIEAPRESFENWVTALLR